MATILFTRKLTPAESKSIVDGLTKWFKQNPRRRVCMTLLGPFGKRKFSRKGYKEELKALTQ